MAAIQFIVTNQQGEVMSNNFEGWKHINTAPKDRRILVWTGGEIYAAHWVQCPTTGREAYLVSQDIEGTQHLCHPSHWRGCPQPPVEALPDDEE